MSRSARSAQPKVFIAFAGDDRPMAELLGKELEERGITPFVDAHNILVGEDIVLTIDKAIDEADYFVLLWSRHTVDRRWVDVEWTAALALELDQRRPFLFVVCLDNTSLPRILAIRRYLDAFGNWESVADTLVATWDRQRTVGVPVLPPPVMADTSEPSIVLYVRNQQLSVAHVLRVSTSATGQQLQDAVRTALALPEQVTGMDGQVGITFHYQLGCRGLPIPSDETLSTLNITEYCVIDLEVEIDSWGPDGSVARTRFRQDEPAGLHPAMPRTLSREALKHLQPHQE